MASIRSLLHSPMNSPYSFSRRLDSAISSSRLLAFLCVIHVVAAVAEAPTSEPSTPESAVISVVSIVFGSLARDVGLSRRVARSAA